jgi:hypothetical protein
MDVNWPALLAGAILIQVFTTAQVFYRRLGAAVFFAVAALSIIGGTFFIGLGVTGNAYFSLAFAAVSSFFTLSVLAALWRGLASRRAREGPHGG